MINRFMKDGFIKNGFKNKKIIFSLLVALLLNGCIYTNIETPLDQDLDETRLGDKVGEASMRSVMWVAAWGDASTRAAAEQGGITVIRHADRKRLVVFFGIYAEETTVVYGD